jgi:hypothetical protein
MAAQFTILIAHRQRAGETERDSRNRVTNCPSKSGRSQGFSLEKFGIIYSFEEVLWLTM